MTIVTSYFGKLSKLKSDGYLCIAICRYVPGYYTDLHMPVLSPSATLLYRIKHKLCSNSEYTAEFLNQLHSLNYADIMHAFCTAALNHNTNKIALLCYETPSQFCHRHLVANWLNEHNNNIQEYK